MKWWKWLIVATILSVLGLLIYPAALAIREAADRHNGRHTALSISGDLSHINIHESDGVNYVTFLFARGVAVRLRVEDGERFPWDHIKGPVLIIYAGDRFLEFVEEEVQ